MKKIVNQLREEANLQATHDGMNPKSNVVEKSRNEPHEPHNPSDRGSSDESKKDLERERP